MTRHTLRTSLVLLAALALGACGGAKRRPEVATANPDRAGAAGRPSGESQAPPVETVDSGPDLAAAEGSDLSGTDLSPTDITAEGSGGPLADIRFDFDRATLTEGARATLERHAEWLQTHRDVRIRIEGHCDERGTVEYNLALGEQRARVTRDYLLSLGVAGERLEVVSLGKERPLDPGHDEAAWEKNRRAHFAVTR